MTPVISPWVFYWMLVCDNLSFIVYVVSALSLIVFLFLIAVTFTMTFDYGEDDEDVKTNVRMIKKLTPIVIVLTLLACLIPSEKTLTKMVLAQNVTYERVETVTDTVTTVYNDIMDLFAEESED